MVRFTQLILARVTLMRVLAMVIDSDGVEAAGFEFYTEHSRTLLQVGIG
ncbi:hypothetical protein N9Z61_01780 [bacterium]|nr:hypothetical protein [bacterium]MDB4379559.1 hypothetical protein [bacterium]